MKEIIIKRASALFIKYGISSVRTEDISRHTGISKRTLYSHFKSKELLVQDVVSLEIDILRMESEKILTVQTKAIDQFVALWNYVYHYIHVSNPNFFRDLARYYPESWSVMMQFKSVFRQNFLAANLQKGISQGVYRQDIDVDVLSLLWLEVMGIHIKEFKSCSVIKAHFLRGLLTAEGLQMIEQQSVLA